MSHASMSECRTRGGYKKTGAGPGLFATRAVIAAVVLSIVAIATPASADNLTVGVFAPSAPFPNTGARIELASRLGDHLGKALGGTGTGRVYARASDFAAAVKKGEVSIALVDATYAASASGFTVVAAAPEQGWQLVARGASKIADLKGKRVLVPSNGGRETDFVLNVMFGGLEKDFFGKVDVAPDTAATLAALNLAKADAAIVPASADLPSGVTRVTGLPTLSGPVLVVYGLTAQQRATVASAVAAFKGDGTIGGFQPADGAGVAAIRRRFTVAVKRGPLVVPAVRLLVGDLVEGRTFAIERAPVTSFAGR